MRAAEASDRDAEEKAAKIRELQHRLDLLARQLFGDKAERVDANQFKLAFDQVTEEGEAPPPFVEVPCWARTRRKFFEAKDTARVESAWAMHAISRLFEIEREATQDELDVEERRALREEKSRPTAESLLEWLESLRDTMLPRSPLAKAVGYARNQKEALLRFLEDGRLKLDNNRAERSLRQVAVGRKNWLLLCRERQGRAPAAVLYTLVVSCKELGLNHIDYLRDVIVKAASPDFPASRIAELTHTGWARAST